MQTPLENNERKRIVASRESIQGKEEYIVIKYKLTATNGLSLEEAASRCLLITSLRTLRKLDYETTADRLLNAGKVINIINNGLSSSGLVEIAYPISQCSKTEGITHLLTLITSAAEYNYTQSFWVDSIELPNSFLKRYEGPKFGVQGIRDIFNINDKPILGLVLKPRNANVQSLTKIHNSAKEALIGGVDFLVDDLLLVDPESEMSFKNRVQKFVSLCNYWSRASPKKYFVNISTDPFKAVEYAQRAIELGAGGVLINAFTMGFGGAEFVIKSINGKIPVICSNMGSGIMSRGIVLGLQNANPTGLSEAVVVKLSRLIGSDAIHTGTSASECFGEDAWGPATNSLKYFIDGIKPCMAVAEGDLTVANLWDNIKSLENDLLIEATSGIINYPGGATKGAQAFKKLIKNLDPEMDDRDAHKTITQLFQKDSSLEQGLKKFNYSQKNSHD